MPMFTKKLHNNISKNNIINTSIGTNIDPIYSNPCNMNSVYKNIITTNNLQKKLTYLNVKLIDMPKETNKLKDRDLHQMEEKDSILSVSSFKKSDCDSSHNSDENNNTDENDNNVAEQRKTIKNTKNNVSHPMYMSNTMLNLGSIDIILGKKKL